GLDSFAKTCRRPRDSSSISSNPDTGDADLVGLAESPCFGTTSPIRLFQKDGADNHAWACSRRCHRWAVGTTGQPDESRWRIAVDILAGALSHRAACRRECVLHGLSLHAAA